MRSCAAHLFTASLLGGLVLGSVACAPSPSTTSTVPLVSPPPTGLGEPLAAHLVSLTEQANNAPSDPLRRIELARTYEAHQLWANAKDAFTAARTLGAADALLLFHTALVEQELGHSAQADALFEATARTFPSFAPARDRVGAIRLDQGDLEGAAAAFGSVTRLAPNEGAGYFGLAQVRLAQGNPGPAVELAGNGLARTPRDRRGSYVLGLALRELGRLEEARAALARGAGSRREFLSDEWSADRWRFARLPGVAVEEARQALGRGEFDRAAQLAQQAREWDPRSTKAHNTLAVARLAQRRPAEACAALEPALALEPDDLDTLINHATCLSALGRHDEALASATRAEATAPHTAAAHHTLGRVLLSSSDQQRWPIARRSLATAHTLDPGDTEVTRDLAFLDLQLGDLAGARKGFSQLALEAPFEPWAFLGLAEVALQQGDVDAAQHQLELARQLAPAHPGVASLASRLAPGGGP